MSRLDTAGCRPDEPVIVVVGAGDRMPPLAAVADVLIIVAGPGGARCGELFRRFPGLTLAVLLDGAPGLVVGVRDGTLLVLVPTRPWSPASCPPVVAAAPVRELARVLYARWVAGRSLAARSVLRWRRRRDGRVGQGPAMPDGFRVVAGVWGADRRRTGGSGRRL